MGSYLSTNRQNDQEAEGQLSSGAYKYPPKAGGPYFSNHFIMGGEKFDTPQPEAFLFGENSDLNFLGPKPAPFPYPPPQASEPTKTLRSLLNIRRDSVQIVPVPGQAPIPSCPAYDSDADEYQQQRICDESQRIWALHRDRKYNLQFTFDTDVRCAITVSYFCTEEISPIAATYNVCENSGGFKSETYYYKRGANQHFNQPSHVIHPGGFKDSNLAFHDNDDSNAIIPIAIQCVALDGDSPRQAHTTVASFERTHDGAYVLKNIKQKLFVDGLSYLLQEIYGLENKSSDLPANKGFDEDYDDCGADCVVCMCDLRDTIILPCRHLCLCYACAESLRYQASNCPICRAPFIALLQIRAVQKMSHNTHPALAGTEPLAQEGVPPGYTSISLIEALNGPSSVNHREDTPIPVAASAASAVVTAPVTPAGAASGDVTTGSGAPSRHGHKKNRGKRRGSNSNKPRPSGSVSSQISSSNANSPLREEAEPASVHPDPDPEPVPETSGIVKIKSADTNVRVSLKIVNEVESIIPRSNLDIVEEELAKMAVAESLNDIPDNLEHVIQDIDEDLEELDEDESSTEDDEAGQEGDDELEEELDKPLKNLQKVGSEPGTPMSHTSERSSQTSAGSTKQLLPKNENPVQVAGKTTPLQHESKIVMVASKDDEDLDDLEDENEDFC